MSNGITLKQTEAIISLVGGYLQIKHRFSQIAQTAELHKRHVDQQ